MRKLILSILFLVNGVLLIKGQTIEYKDVYKQAFNEQLQMLNGQKQIDFKRAVFLSEYAYHKGQISYQKYCNDISTIGQQLNLLIKQRGFEKYKTAGNWAVFTYMTDSLPINNYKPYTYDFDDFMGEKDWTKMFVTKLMKTKGGNCHSMPYFYKILSEEIGTKASLALAPNHCYIKHIDEKGQWTNVELTNGGFPRDQWIIKEMAITVEAIKNEIYMKPLTDKENIALTIYDLAEAYIYQFGNDKFVLEICDTALNYFPKCIPLQMIKANCIKDFIETEKKKINYDISFISKNIDSYKQIVITIDGYGYKDMPLELYKDWVNMVEKEKIKRGLTTK